jgi:uncharacterized protein YbjT (DUF2867 family)
VRVAVVGATGTIGRPLVDVLSVEHDVLAWQGGHPRWRGTGSTGLLLMQPMPSRSIARLTGSTSSTTSCTRSAAGSSRSSIAGTRQIVYLGGLGEGAVDLSPHLRSRAEAAKILAAGQVPVTTLRAAMIVGPGSTAFETILALVERLPLMVCPRWVRKRLRAVVARLLGRKL